MQETKYANARSVMEMVKLGAFATEIGAAAKDTAKTAKTDREKAWARKLKCVNTYLNNILTERLEALDPEQLKSVERRAGHTVVEIMSSDKARLEKEKDYETYEPITMAAQDVFTLAELMLIGCRMCPQGKYVAECPYRAIMHRACIPVLRENPATGECEFMGDNGLDLILPNGNQEQVEIFAQKFAEKNLHILRRPDRKVSMI